MKKILPTRGFTLVELLVVIAIIAILAVIGIAIFAGVQARARDARRQADATAMAKALEANKVPGSTNYPQILASWFGGGAVPAEAAGSGYIPQYSIVYVTATGFTVNKPTVWAANSANPSSAGTTPVGGVVTVATVASGIPASGSIYSFQVCALLETGTAPNIFCVPNSQ